MEDSVHVVTQWIISTGNPGDEITTLVKVGQPLQKTCKSDRSAVLTDKSSLDFFFIRWDGW
uniref:Uncharacterized protein n=1 Tax=Arundo donax TaxID=35708 RepID=A0A0A9GQV0_ARUDO